MGMIGEGRSDRGSNRDFLDVEAGYKSLIAGVGEDDGAGGEVGKEMGKGGSSCYILFLLVG